MLFLQGAPPTNPVSAVLNSAEWIFPTCEIFHIVGFGIAIGTIAVVDLSLLGLGFKQKAATRLRKDTALWTLTALVVVLTAGFVLFLTSPLHYLYNSAFQLKMTTLFLAIIFNYTVHRKVASSEIVSPGAGILVGAASLALWLTVVASGLFIAFVPEAGGY